MSQVTLDAILAMLRSFPRRQLAGNRRGDKIANMRSNWVATMSLAICGALWASCVAVPPDPAAMARDLPEPRTLDADESAARDGFLDRTRTALGDGLLDDAEAAVLAALDVDPASARGHALLGAVFMRRAQATAELPDIYLWRWAEGHLARAAALAPTDPEVAALQSRFFGADGHFAAAAEAAERGLRGNPVDSTCLTLAGGWRYELGEELAARPHLEAFLALYPNDPLALYRLGVCRATAARLPGASSPAEELRLAADSFERYLTVIPDDPHGYLAAARTLIELGELDPERRAVAASSALRHAIEGARRYPRRADFPYLMGLSRELLEQDVDGAYEKALELQPTHVGATLREAARILKDGETPEAVARVTPLLQRILDADPLRSDLLSRERRRIGKWLRAHEPQADAGGGIKRP